MIRALAVSRTNANTAEANRADTATLELFTLISNMQAQIQEAQGPLDTAIEQAKAATTALTQANSDDPYVRTSTFTPVKIMTESHNHNPLLTNPLPLRLHAFFTSLPHAKLENLLTALIHLSNTTPDTTPPESTERRDSRAETQRNLDKQVTFNASTADALKTTLTLIDNLSENLQALS